MGSATGSMLTMRMQGVVSPIKENEESVLKEGEFRQR